MDAATIERGDLGAVGEKLDSAALPVVLSVIGELMRAPEQAVEALFRLSDEEVGGLLRHARQVGRKKSLSAGLAPADSGRVPPARAVSPGELDAFLGPFTTSEYLWHEELIKKKLLLNSLAMRAALGSISRQALSQSLKANRIFSVDMAGEAYFPAFYADPRINRRLLEGVSKILGELSGWSKWQFFTQPKESLGGVTPIAALRSGKSADVRRAAQGFVER